METTARRALSELIDSLLTPEPAPAPVAAVPALAPVETAPAVPVPAPAAPTVPLQAVPLQSVPPLEDSLDAYGIRVQPDHPVRPVPSARPAVELAPAAVPAAFTVLPGGAKSAILWRSR